MAHYASVVKRAKRFSDRLSRNSIIVCLYFGPLVSGESVVADVTRKYHLRIHTPRNSMWVRQQAGGPNNNYFNNTTVVPPWYLGSMYASMYGSMYDSLYGSMHGSMYGSMYVW